MALDEMLQMDDLIKSFKVARTTIYEWMRKEDFPKPSKIGGKNFWMKTDIEAYIESSKEKK